MGIQIKKHKQKVMIRDFLITFLGFGIVPLINMRTLKFDEPLIKFSIYWKNYKDEGYFFPYIVAWFLNLGLFPFISFLSYYCLQNQIQKILYFSSHIVFLIGNIIAFSNYQPVQMFYFMPTWVSICSIFVNLALAKLFNDITNNEEIKGIILAFSIIIYISMTLSSICGLKRNIFSYSEVWTETDETIAQYLIQNTNKQSVFLAPIDDFNPVSTLAGRRVVKSNERMLFTSGFEWYMYNQEIKTLLSNPDSDVLPYVHYSLEHDRKYTNMHLRAPETSKSWKMCYGYEAYQLFNRTISKN